MNEDSNTIQATDVQKYITGASFPCQKQQLISYAKGKNAPKEVMDMLQGLPNKEYAAVSDVSSALEM